MAGNCNQKNPLKHSGTNRMDRLRKSLFPEEAKVDDRQLEDLVLYARKYAQYIQYYGPQNSLDGDWTGFFSNDPTAIFASVVKHPSKIYFEFYTGLSVYLQVDRSKNPSLLSSHFKLFFHVPLLLLKEIGGHFERLEKFHPLRFFMQRQFNTELRNALEKLIAYYKGAINQGIFTAGAIVPSDYDAPGSITLPDLLLQHIEDMEAVSALDLATSYLDTVVGTDWNTFYASIAANDNPYLEGVDIFERIYDALNYSLLTQQMSKFFVATENLGKEAEQYLKQSLEEYQEHRPDYALFLAFAQLFRNNQDQLNKITERHLNYYYKDILQLTPKAAEPQKAFLTFELSKNIADHLLSSGTLFKDGKDDLGKEVVFQLDQDIVVNKASIGALKSLFIPERQAQPKNYLEPMAAFNVATADGLEEPLKKEQHSWPVFGPIPPVSEKTMPHARLGFALADQKLFLKEGFRTVWIVADLNTTPGYQNYPNLLKANCTGEKEWVTVGAENKSTLISFTFDNYFIVILAFEAEALPIVPYNAEVHGPGYETENPVIALSLNFDDEASQPTNFERYTDLKNLKFTKMSIVATANNVRDVIVQNDNGIVDTTKPFNLFGASPTVGSSFIIGSKEITAKPLQYLGVQWEYQETYSTAGFLENNAPNSFQLKFNHLKNGTWAGDAGYTRNLFVDGNAGFALKSRILSITDLSDLSVHDDLAKENEPFSTGATNGYFRFSLGRDFGHDEYTNAYTLAMIAKAGGTAYVKPANFNDSNAIPNAPYNPVVTDFKLSYISAYEEVQQLFHLHPFGITAVEDQALEYVFPSYENEGELYIGIADLAPPQKASFLFQLAEGTSNPLKNPTPVKWYFLQEDTWIQFADQDVDDKTNNLSGSGLVGLSIPDTATNKNHLLDSGLHWIRLSVAKDSDALNQIIAIKLQAAQVTFLDQDNDPQFPAKTLPLGEITKLKSSDPAVKKIDQPYNSFGGRAPETNNDFYVRASERLRHKDRAVQIWDYEQLVLEAFPEIYKVKCINHTQICRDTNSTIIADNELKPGHVLVVTVPDLKNLKLIDPLRPYTKKSTLTKIDEFLRSRISPFVNLEVQNPKFEEVQVDFQIAFLPEIGDIQFYSDLLKQAIIEFLSPWAFDSSSEISFGGKIHKSSIINFVEEQLHVDFVKEFKMYHKKDIGMKDSDWGKVDLEVIETQVSRTIFVSHATHIIREVI